MFRKFTILLYINSCSSIKDKATAFFQLNDLDAEDKLSKDNFVKMVLEILTLVGTYSIRMGDFDEEDVPLWTEKMNENVSHSRPFCA